MTTSNKGNTVDEILWDVYGAGAESMEDGGGSDHDVIEARQALGTRMLELTNGLKTYHFRAPSEYKMVDLEELQTAIQYEFGLFKDSTTRGSESLTYWDNYYKDGEGK